jgi:undecaprenyl phosphate-alpha-L-ara4N flippase subunit ArnE
LPLGVAFPLMTLSYAAIPAAAHVWLKDRLSRRQWCGVLLVTSGVALVGLSGL